MGKGEVAANVGGHRGGEDGGVNGEQETRKSLRLGGLTGRWGAGAAAGQEGGGGGCVWE